MSKSDGTASPSYVIRLVRSTSAISSPPLRLVRTDDRSVESGLPPLRGAMSASYRRFLRRLAGRRLSQPSVRPPDRAGLRDHAPDAVLPASGDDRETIQNAPLDVQRGVVPT
jgi:hypothetical protein